MTVEMEKLKSREEWLNARSGIGGSDAAAIVGCNPYMTNIDLWEYLTGKAERPDISEKPYVKYGVEAEKHLRDLFAMDYPQYKVRYEENNIWHNDKIPFAHASLDGWLLDEDGRDGILEIKTTEILRSQQKELWNDRVPENYYCQILHYLMVTGFEFAVLKAQLKSSFGGEVYLQTKHYKWERKDVLDDIKYLYKEEKAFYDAITNNIKPSLVLPPL